MVVLRNDLVVDISEHNYTLMIDRHTKDKKGNPMYKTLGYYNSLASAVNGARDYCTKKQLGSGEYDLREAIEEMKRISAEFMNLLHSEMEKRGNNNVE